MGHVEEDASSLSIINKNTTDKNGHKDHDDSIDDQVVVQSLNERHLNQGRSLARPQNKAVAKADLERLQDL